jgi:RNA polymerase sigma-70 factor, ECF subfamily
MNVGIGGERDRAAFQELARSELPRLYSLARRLGDPDPEDLVQECFLRAYRSFGTLQKDEAGGGWLRTILVNVFRDRLRRKARTPQEVPMEDVAEFSLYRTIAEEDPFPYSDSLHLDFLGAFDEDDVHRVLMELPLHYRAPLVLRRFRHEGDRCHARRTPGHDPGSPASWAEAVRAADVVVCELARSVR